MRPIDSRITDPDAAAYVASLGPSPRRAGTSPAEIRARPRASSQYEASYRVDSEDVALPWPSLLRARIYRHRDLRARATVVYLHGGGWALGDLEINDDVCRYLVDRTGLALVSLEYPLAPEHPFPEALDAATTVADMIASGALPTCPSQVILAGLSAGAALAAGVVARGIRGTWAGAASLVMLSPVTDSDLTRGSYVEFADAPVLTAEDMQWFWSMYDADGTARHSPEAAPIRGTLTGFPPTTVVVAGVDPLRDEGIAFAGELARAGVDVEMAVVPGVPHGFMAVPSILAGRRCLARVASRLDEILAL